MELKDLYGAIKKLGRPHFYPLNEPKSDTHMLEYHKKERVWVFYYLDERGGKSGLKTFSTEEEACKYILNDAIEFVKTLTNSTIDMFRREYLDGDKSVLSNSYHPMPLYDIIFAIKELGRHKDDYLKELDRNAMAVYRSEYNKKKKVWEYGLFSIGEKELSFKVFPTEEEACEYVIDKAVEVLRDFGKVWKEAIVERDKRITERSAEPPGSH